MIRFHDFAPKQLAGEGFFQSARYESFDAAVGAAGEWIEQQQVRVVSIETVVLPNIWREEGTQDPELRTIGGYGNWHQFVRVWYEAD